VASVRSGRARNGVRVLRRSQPGVSGIRRWRAVLQCFSEITAELTKRFGGTVVKSTGDGHLITFDGPTQSIRCAEALRDDAERGRDARKHPVGAGWQTNRTILIVVREMPRRDACISVTCNGFRLS
jgi:hypothetical protein